MKERNNGIEQGQRDRAWRSGWSLVAPSGRSRVRSPCRLSSVVSPRVVQVVAVVGEILRADGHRAALLQTRCEWTPTGGRRSASQGEATASQPIASHHTSSCSPFSRHCVQSLAHAPLFPSSQRRELYGKERGHLLVADMAVEFEPDKLVIDIRSRSTGQTRLLKAPTERVRNKQKEAKKKHEGRWG